MATVLPFLTLNLLQTYLEGDAMILTYSGIALGFTSGMAVAENQIFKIRRKNKKQLSNPVPGEQK